MIEIDSVIRCPNLNLIDRAKLQAELTIQNPDYAKRKAMHLPLWGHSAKIHLYTMEGNTLIIPRGFASRLPSFFPGEKYSNNMCSLPEVNFDSRIILRDYQEPVNAAVKKYKQGVIVAPCGSGKTEMGLQAAAELRQPTLWLTHTKDLINQAAARAIGKMGLNAADIGYLTADKWTIGKKITFGMVQTMARRDLSEIVNQFGTVIIDEAHHTFKNADSVAQFYSVISHFPAFYRFGLTASEHRSDGLIDTMYLIIGPKIFEITQESLRKTEQVITPTVEFITTDFEYSPDEDQTIYVNYQKMIEAMKNDNTRNAWIAQALIRVFREGDHALILGDSLDHLQSFFNYFQEKYRCAFIHAHTKKPIREAALQAMRDSKIDILFATYILAKEGLDIPPLNKLFLITPKRDKVIIQQSLGRIMRPSPGKEKAFVYDFFDHRVSICVNQAKSRNTLYKQLGCKILNSPSASKKKAEEDLINTLKNGI